jgi:hypothetical protein
MGSILRQSFEIQTQDEETMPPAPVLALSAFTGYLST